MMKVLCEIDHVLENKIELFANRHPITALGVSLIAVPIATLIFLFLATGIIIVPISILFHWFL